jgi:hypothetical protein
MNQNNQIDPNSPKTTGLDAGGRNSGRTTRSLGDTDSMGHFVGYIDEEGGCWESCRERDLTLTCGRYRDAWYEWNRSGGVLGNKPDARKIAESVCRETASIDEAVREAEGEFDPTSPFSLLTMGVIALKKFENSALN